MMNYLTYLVLYYEVLNVEMEQIITLLNFDKIIYERLMAYDHVY